MEGQCSSNCACNMSGKGFLFTPSEEELLIHYLHPKLQGESLPCKRAIAEHDVYSSNPWEIFRDDDPHWVPNPGFPNKKTIYVFTPVKRNGIRGIRTAGSGTWSGQNKKPVKNIQGKVIGSKHSFSFKEKTTSADNQGSWSMYEYYLPGVDKYAVCAITCATARKDGDDQPKDYEDYDIATQEEGPFVSHTNDLLSHDCAPKVQPQQQPQPQMVANHLPSKMWNIVDPFSAPNFVTDEDDDTEDQDLAKYLEETIPEDHDVLQPERESPTKRKCQEYQEQPLPVAADSGSDYGKTTNDPLLEGFSIFDEIENFDFTVFLEESNLTNYFSQNPDPDAMNLSFIDQPSGDLPMKRRRCL